MTRFFLFVCYTAMVLMITSPAVGSDSPGTETPAEIDLSALDFEHIAVMPFIVGQLESPDGPNETPLSLSLRQINSPRATLAEGAPSIMTRLVHTFLQVRFGEQLLPLAAATETYAAIVDNPELDTPRKLAVRFGTHLKADLVVVGTVWRFREKGVDKEMPGSQASVAFAVYLVDVASGRRLWRNGFDGTQKILSEDLLEGLKQARVDLRWVSATELARLGVKAAFRRFPLP